MLLTIVSFVFVFTVVALVHEFGHLYFAKKAGIRVHEFGLGFGPSLFSFKRNHTTYKINLLPILGYVNIAGLETDLPQEKETPENEKYYNKSTGAKFKAIFAGPFTNLILGFVLFSFVFSITGIPTGISNELSAISPGSQASKIGLQPGDKLEAINGKRFENPEDAISLIHQSANKRIILSISRGSKIIQFPAVPEYHKRMKVGLIGFSLKPIYKKVGLLGGMIAGLQQTAGISVMIIFLLGRLITGQIALGDLAGPVGIAQITGQYAHQGLISLLGFLAFFSVNVAVLNLLPIPALDGGRLFFLIIEFIRRKPLNIEKENKIHQVGLFILLGFLAILTVNDFLRIFLR